MGNYTLDQAQRDIADLRGQIAHGLAFSEFLSLATGSIAIDDAGGDTYNAGQLTKFSTSNTAIISTSDIQINNLTFDVGTGESYLVRGRIKAQAGASGTAQAVSIRFKGTASVSLMLIFMWGLGQGLAQSGNYGEIVAMDTDSNELPTTIANGRFFYFDFEGIITVSAGGTFNVVGRNTILSADETFTIFAGSYTQLMRI